MVSYSLVPGSFTMVDPISVSDNMCGNCTVMGDETVDEEVCFR